MNAVSSPPTTTMNSQLNNSNNHDHSSSEIGAKILASISNHTETLMNCNYQHDYHHPKDNANGESSSNDEDLLKLSQKYKQNRQKFQLNDNDEEEDVIEDDNDSWEATNHFYMGHKSEEPCTKHTTASTSKITTLQGLQNQQSYASFSVLEQKGLSSSISLSCINRKRQQWQQQQQQPFECSGRNMDANKGNNTGRRTNGAAKSIGRNTNIFSSMEDIIDCSSSSSSSSDDKVDEYSRCHGIVAQQNQVVAQKYMGQDHNVDDEEEKDKSEDYKDDDIEEDLIVLPKKHCYHENDKILGIQKDFKIKLKLHQQYNMIEMVLFV